jgi:regulator of nucleoside diphosphate kinase
MHTITITHEDNARLRMLLLLTPYNPRLRYELALLKAELDRAIVVSSDRLPDEIIRIGSSFAYEDVGSGVSGVFTLCLPHQEQTVESSLSVLSRFGIAVLGRTAGTIIDWAGTPAARQTIIKSVISPARVRRNRSGPPRRRPVTRAAVAT